MMLVENVIDNQPRTESKGFECKSCLADKRNVQHVRWACHAHPMPSVILISQLGQYTIWNVLKDVLIDCTEVMTWPCGCGIIPVVHL